MPERDTIERAKEDKKEGKSLSTQAGEFIREEMHHIREGKHGARSPQQAIAIGLSKARRAGVDLPPKKNTSAKVKAQARRDIRKGKTARNRKPSARRSHATLGALKKESGSAASRASLSRHARSAARKRGKHARQGSAMRAARTRKAERSEEE